MVTMFALQICFLSSSHGYVSDVIQGFFNYTIGGASDMRRKEQIGGLQMTRSIRNRMSFVFGLALLTIASMPILSFAADEAAETPALYATAWSDRKSVV